MGGNFGEFVGRKGTIGAFLKSPRPSWAREARWCLPPSDANIFHHEAELVAVISATRPLGSSADGALRTSLATRCGCDVRAASPPSRASSRASRLTPSPDRAMHRDLGRGPGPASAPGSIWVAAGAARSLVVVPRKKRSVASCHHRAHHQPVLSFLEGMSQGIVPAGRATHI